MNQLKRIIRFVISKSLSLLSLLSKTGLISRGEYYNRLTEMIIKKVARNDSTCIDVGCHHGDILDIMIRYAPSGTFFAFEPLPQLYDMLTAKYSANVRVTVYNIALSNTTGESSFNYVITNPGYSGLKKRRYDRPHEEDTTITVSTGLLDELCCTSGFDLLKIDVEGAELQVLQGGRKSIKTYKPFIIFEHGQGSADCYGTKPENVFSLLVDYCGLKINLLDRFLRNQRPLSKEEFCRQYYEIINYYFIAYDI